jgi:arginine utilization regulatory protein
MVALSAGRDILDEHDLPTLGKAQSADSLVSLSLEEVDAVDMGAILRDVETSLIDWALARHQGNLARAADILGVPRSTLQYKASKRSGPLSDSVA